MILGWDEMLTTLILASQMMLLALVVCIVFGLFPLYVYGWIVKKRNQRMERLFKEKKIDGFTYW